MMVLNFNINYNSIVIRSLYSNIYHDGTGSPYVSPFMIEVFQIRKRGSPHVSPFMAGYSKYVNPSWSKIY